MINKQTQTLLDKFKNIALFSQDQAILIHEVLAEVIEPSKITIIS